MNNPPPPPPPVRTTTTPPPSTTTNGTTTDGTTRSTVVLSSSSPIHTQLHQELDDVERALNEHSSPVRTSRTTTTSSSGSSSSSSPPVVIHDRSNNNSSATSTRSSTIAATSSSSSITTTTATSTTTTTAATTTTTTTTSYHNPTVVSHGGRAVFESLSSALRSIRRRFQQQQLHADEADDADVVDATPTTTTPTTTTEPNRIHDHRSATSSFSQRLETVERAHATRTPLHVLRQRDDEEQQQLQQQDPPLPVEAGTPLAVQEKNGTTTTTSSGSRSSSVGGGGGGSTGSESDGSSSRSSSSSTSRRRRQSILVASRRYADAHETNEIALHEDASVTLPWMEEAQQEQNISPHNNNEDDDDVLETNVLPPAVTLPTMDSQTLPAENQLLCSTANSPRQGSSASLEIDKEPNMVPPSIYSWGPSPHFDLLGVEEQTNEDGYSSHIPPPPLSSPSSSSPTTTTTMSLVPTVIPSHSRVGRSELVSVSFGEAHVALATASGSLLICGDNSHGAVDPWASPPSQAQPDHNEEQQQQQQQHRVDTSIRKPMHLESILTLTTRVLQVACGLDHTAILTENRSVLTFGSNRHGQLGHRMCSTTSSGTPSAAAALEDSFRFQPPAALVLPLGKRAAQIACGHGFTLVLTTQMQVYMCGRQEISGYNYRDVLLEQQQQETGMVSSLPHEHPSLQGLPLVHVRAGHDHAVVVTSHGTAYAWGVNITGACGREFPTNLTVPVPFLVPSSHFQPPSSGTPIQRPQQHRRQAPFSNWAAWDETYPHHISLANDVAVVDAACGKDTTILVTQTGQLLVAGSNDQFQLGIVASVVDDATNNPQQPQHPVSTVQIIHHPTPGRSFVSAQAGSFHTLLLDDQGDVWCMGQGAPLRPIVKGKSIGTIAAGGTHSLAIAAKPNYKPPPTTLTATSMMMATTMKRMGEPGRPRRITNDLDGLLHGIWLETENSKQWNAVHELATQTEELFRSPAVMNSVFLDPTEIDELYKKLLSATKEPKWRQMVVSAMERGMVQGLESLKDTRLMYPEGVRCLLLYLQCPLFRQPGEGAWDVQFDVRGDTISLLCETILGLPFEGYKALIVWSTSMYAKELFVPFLVSPLIDQLNAWIEKQRTRVVPLIVGVLRWFQNVAERFPDEVISKHEDFYSTGIANLSMEALFEDLIRYKRAPKGQRSANFFVCASPFLMSPSCKRNLLQIENQMTMVHAAQAGGVQFDLGRRQFLFNPYFVMAIDRPFLLQQTLHAVACASPSELKKSLKIVFKGEEGVDAGGVTKEFFQLLVIQLFDINTGMWTTSFGDFLHTWFNADCTWNQDGYYLVGVLVGLAVYNSVILDVHFPQAIYRKLLGLPLGLEDMVDPEVRKGLQALLDYKEDDVEDVFCLTFEVTWNSLGMERKKELKPGGADIAVTSDNKEEYVMLYVKWLLVDSIQRQYVEFERGFMQVMEGSSLELLRPEELELLVVGTPELNFAALQENTEYDGGFDKNSPVVRNLWRFVLESPREVQLQFLKFSTGTTKAPIGGLGAMPFKIQRAGPDSMQLPTSHTCFNTLLVPDYGDNYEKLKDRLGRAIVECEGFGLK